MKTLALELRHLVSQSVALLGNVIQRELGTVFYQQIENIRQRMVQMRSLPDNEAYHHIEDLFDLLEQYPPEDRHHVAHSFTLMLELMNACENAYRSHRLAVSPSLTSEGSHYIDGIIYVLTAHPTEARSPLNISIFHQIQNLLVQVLNRSSLEKRSDLSSAECNDLTHLLEIAWRIPIVRERSPKVKDEAEHIYSLLFREDVLYALLDFSENHAPFYVRSWVGGDKDGHPGVDEKVLLESLTLSRRKILDLFKRQIHEIRQTLQSVRLTSLQKELSRLEISLQPLNSLKKADAKRVQQTRSLLNDFASNYKDKLGASHPALRKLRQLSHLFPGFVVPLELRESSDVLMAPRGKTKKAIVRMLEALKFLASDHDPRWYARGFIISMTESIEHIRKAAQLQAEIFGDIRIPVIPLFEEASSLKDSDHIMQEMTKDRVLKAAAKKHWSGLIEMMVGYSDSAKEAGSLKSRISIAEALPRLEKVCLAADLTPVFFHGSGGSIDRGGGSIEDQTAWWPPSALRRYKCTIQGEMVERSLASPEIAQRQLEKIYENAVKGLSKKRQSKHSSTLDLFAEKVSSHYREQITSPEFLRMVEAATPYSYLNVLKIGSRPAKRAQQLQVSGLRAIPWVLCWTQTRVLFQTWWGVGSAWQELSQSQKDQLRQAFLKDAVFTSYVKALGFTLAKIEMEVWRLYLEKSLLSEAEKQLFMDLFRQEYEKTLQCFHELTGTKQLLWFRPWLAESIYLRSAMIHPLNVLQILAKDDNDVHLLRVTVTGISSGMLTTG